jgi:uncharacterized oligopeptide transporter (OPT) family protein
MFAAAVALCALRDALPRRFARFVPSPMAMGIPFYIGANNAINFWLGSVVVHIWGWLDPAGCDALSTIIGSGLLVGGGVWAVPSAVLAIAGVNPPICMAFSAKPPS